MQRNVASDVLRAAITISGKAPSRIAKDAGVDHAAMSRFINRKRGLTLRSFDRVAAVLDLELVQRRRSA